jgi:hypothetical protein
MHVHYGISFIMSTFWRGLCSLELLYIDRRTSLWRRYNNINIDNESCSLYIYQCTCFLRCQWQSAYRLLSDTFFLLLIHISCMSNGNGAVLNLDHCFALKSWIGPGTRLGEWGEFWMKHAPEVGSNSRPSALQPSALPLSYGGPLHVKWDNSNKRTNLEKVQHEKNVFSAI